MNEIFRKVSMDEWLLWSNVKFGKQSLSSQWLLLLIKRHSKDFLINRRGFAEILKKINIKGKVNYSDYKFVLLSLSQ